MHLNRSIEYRPEIDGLRAVAVILVVLYHAFHLGVFGSRLVAAYLIKSLPSSW